MSYEPKRFDFRFRCASTCRPIRRPSHRGMKAAMIEAEVGDEHWVGPHGLGAVRSHRRAAGQGAAVFLPSNTMCNQVAIATHCLPGEEILAHEVRIPVKRRRCGGRSRGADQGTDQRPRHVHR
jgi:threonine aldolase